VTGDNVNLEPSPTVSPCGLPVGLTTAEGHEPNLLRKVMGDREIAVPLNKHTANDEHRIVRRGYLIHAALYPSFPVPPRGKVVARLRAGDARADIGVLTSLFINAQAKAQLESAG
jgi:hypothetical protein